MNNLSLNDWLAFAYVVEEQSFTKAAEKIGLSPSMVSRRISQLETKLGARLLQRSTRSISLTESGRIFYEHCSRIKLEVESASSAVSQNHSQPQGTIRVNAPSSFGHAHLVTAASAFMQQYPDIHVELILGSHNSSLIESGLDLAIHTEDLPANSNLIARRIGLRRMHVCGSPEYFKRFGVPKIPDDLTQHNCLLYQLQSTKHEWRFVTKKSEQFIKVSGTFKANSSQALATAAIAGLGLVKLPGYMVNNHLQQKKLISVLKEFCPRDIGIYAVYHSNRHLSTKVKVFIDFITELFSSERYWNEG
jgi:DNA-binding transcriptional LysR family regulator